MTRIRRDRSSPHYNQFQRYTTKEHRNSILKLRCKSKRRDRTLSKNLQFVSNTRKKCTITIDKLNEGINVSIGGWIDDGTDYGGTLN